jgi:outer membrane protein assembly factor BamB
LLYAFSWYDGKSTVSLLDSDGNSKWQYSTPDGSSDYSNMIKYKQIDAATDMVIASSGNLYINYNRIIHLSSSPYSVGSTVTFRDPTGNSNRRLYALYIIDKDNAVSLIYDYTTELTYLATIKF